MNLLGRALSLFRSKALPVTERGSWVTVSDIYNPQWFQLDLASPLADNPRRALAFSAIYSCIRLISGDVAKLRLRLMQRAGTIYQETADHRRAAVLQKPNSYQTATQFWRYWMAQKLTWGYAYGLKDRDGNGIVTNIYPLDSCPGMVVPLVSEDGQVFYSLQRDYLAGVQNLDQSVVVPASEIIHDRDVTPWHPLIGVSPISACGLAAGQGLNIQTNSGKFFQNMSRPSGILTAPGRITKDTAERLKTKFEENFSGKNLGRLLVLGDGLDYKPITVNPVDAQLVEQLRMAVEDVARAFNVPLYKIGLPSGLTLGNSVQYDNDYYTQCLQIHLESIEGLMDVGLELPPDYKTAFDLDGLQRMDPAAQAEADAKLVGASILSPNEARAKHDLSPVEGGDSPLAQQQYYSLAALDERGAAPDPKATLALPAPKAPSQESPSPKEIAAEIHARLPAMPSAVEVARELLALMPKPELIAIPPVPTAKEVAAEVLALMPKPEPPVAPTNGHAEHWTDLANQLRTLEPPLLH